MHNIVKCWWYKEDFLDNCEGCVNFGNEECEHLCALTHRFSTY